MNNTEKTVIGQVLELLGAGKAKDSPEIVALVGSVAGKGDLHEIVKQIVANWNPPPAPPSRVGQALSDPRVLAGGAGVVGIASIPWLQQMLKYVSEKISLPVVESPVALLLIVAVLGALAG